MPFVRQTSILERLARDPPRLEGGIQLSVDLDGDHGDLVRLRHGAVELACRASGLSVPYPSGLGRLMANRPDTELVISERIPAGLRAAAEATGVNYLDLAGRGRVIGQGLVYVVTPQLALRDVVKSPSSPFAQKASRVVRVLLGNPKRAWRLSEVAARVAGNPGNVHRILAALIELGMVERDEDAYLVADPGSMLEAWSDQAQPPRERFVLPTHGELRDTVADLVGHMDGAVVVSGELAAEELAPHLPAQSAIVHCLDPRAFSTLPRDAGRVPQLAGRVRSDEILVDLADEGYGDLRTESHGLPLAAPQQIYVDLARDRGRGREAAEHLRRSLLKF